MRKLLFALTMIAPLSISISVSAEAATTKRTNFNNHYFRCQQLRLDYKNYWASCGGERALARRAAATSSSDEATGGAETPGGGGTPGGGETLGGGGPQTGNAKGNNGKGNGFGDGSPPGIGNAANDNF